MSYSSLIEISAQCDVVPTVSSGSFTLISNGSTTSAQYSCSVGTTISGDVTIACDVNGVWSVSSGTTSCGTFDYACYLLINIYTLVLILYSNSMEEKILNNPFVHYLDSVTRFWGFHIPNLSILLYKKIITLKLKKYRNVF